MNIFKLEPIRVTGAAHTVLSKGILKEEQYYPVVPATAFLALMQSRRPLPCKSGCTPMRLPPDVSAPSTPPDAIHPINDYTARDKRANMPHGNGL